jgi:diaminopimelate decarboxylase
MDAQMAQELADQFGTPYYVYDLDCLGLRAAELRAALPAGSELFYSLKANPLPVVAATLRELGCRAEMSSVGELAVAVEAGFDVADALYTGPGKTIAEVEAALASGVGCFSAESRREVMLLSALAGEAGRKLDVLLRVNPDHRASAGLAMAGRASQFGFDEPDLLDCASELWSAAHLHVMGSHTYLGTQIAAGSLADSFEVGLDVGARLGRLYDMSVLDLGGGFPWPFAVLAAAPDLLAALAQFRQTAASLMRSRQVQLWFESGRYLVASSGTLVARVIDVRRSRGAFLVVLDAGVAHLSGMSGLGRMLAPAAEIRPIEEEPRETFEADVVGPLCTPLDCLARAAQVPQVTPGALVTVSNVGAYGASAGLTGFLSRPSAAEVAMRGRRVVDAARLRTGHVSWAMS